MKKENIMPTVILSVICVTVSLLLAVVNMVTKPIIEKAANDKANATLTVVLPEGESFEEIDISTVELPASVTKAYKETNGKGYVFEMTVSGYKSGLVIMCGVDAEGKITGSKYTASSETFGKEGDLDNAYNGQALDSFTANIISGATKTSNGYADAVKAALQAHVIMGGGSVDLRDPAQILNDNCNAALGTEGLTFTKWFAVEILDGVDAIYTSEGTKNVVMAIGEAFVGVGEDGKAVGADVDADAKAKAEAAYTVYTASKLSEITLPEGASKNVLKAYATASGNFVFELQAAGYGIAGEYYASGEYVKLKVAISADGKIISTLTTYENETDGIGDVCATPEYYEKFNGTTSETYTGVENVSGATVTTSAYKSAIKQAFAAFDLMKGGDEK
jgi:electron transport complex protein RnfG